MDRTISQCARGLLVLVGLLAGHGDCASGGNPPQGQAAPEDQSKRTLLFGDATFAQEYKQYSCGAFSPDGKSLATCADRAKVAIYDLATARRATVLDTSKTINDHLSHLTYAPDGRTIAVGTLSQRSVGLLDATTGELRRRLDCADVVGGPICRVSCLTYAADGTTLAAGFSTGEVVLWDPATGRRIAVTPPYIIPPHTPPNDRAVRPLPAHVAYVAFAPDGKTLWVFATGAPPRAWDAATGVERPFPVPATIDTSIVFSVDGRLVALEDRLDPPLPPRPKPADNETDEAFRRRVLAPTRLRWRLFDAATWEMRSEVGFEVSSQNNILVTTILPDGRAVVTWEDAEAGAFVRLRDANDWRVLSSVAWPNIYGSRRHPANFAAASRDGRWVAFGGVTGYGPGFILMDEVAGTTLRPWQPAP